jgi:thiol-disulfide isomerase/thioredoxin
MQSTELIDALVDTEVLVELEESEFDLSETFSDKWAAFAEQLRDIDESERADLLADELEEPLPPALERVLDNPDLLADYGTVTTLAPELSHTNRLRVLNVLGQFHHGLPPNEGAPEAFLSVHGPRLPGLVRLQRAAIVYVWREDCDPCDIVRGDFDEMFDETPPEDIMLYAVYGPNWAEELDKAFDVQGAPTTLFVLDGEIKTRLLGAHTTTTYENEISILREELDASVVR